MGRWKTPPTGTCGCGKLATSKRANAWCCEGCAAIEIERESEERSMSYHARRVRTEAELEAARAEESK